MLTLYYSPGACSLAAHISLEESGLPYRLHEVSTQNGEHLQPAYAKINPLMRIPTLDLGDGQMLTEVPAILTYVADQVPKLALLPSAGILHARAVEWLSLLASGVHPPFGVYYRPQRFTPSVEIHPRLQTDCHATFFAMLQHVDRRLQDQSACLGDRYSLCDAYALVFYLWGRRTALPVAELRWYSSLATSVLSRPATQRVLEREGLLPERGVAVQP